MKRLEMRAWVQRIYVRLGEPLTPGKRPAAEAFFMNAGKTPASNVQSRIWLALLTREEPLLYPPTEGLFSKTHMGPNAPLSAPVQLREPFNTAYMEGLVSGHFRLVLYGILEYDDIFQQHHKYRWCSVYVPTNPRASENFTSCSEHNDELE
ncbi:MAG: hypothetical protein NT090_12630 [Acidobacteria bacterium]|nr:hypothetical protein [Acidobacteriota bacterium]